MADDIRLDITTVAHNKGLTDAARDMRGLRSEADRLKGTLGTLEDGSFSLDAAIGETREEVHRLREEFARTGDTTLFGDLRRQQSTLNNLSKIKEAIEEVTEAAAEMGGAAVAGGAGGGTGGLFGDLLGGGGRIGAGKIIAGIILGLTPHLPTIGAVIAGAVAGTIGTGGVIGGIAMASKDPRVRVEAARFGKAIQEEFFGGGDVFVEPTIRSLRELQMAFNDMDLPETFAKMAPHVETIAKGFGDLGRNIMPGLNKAFDRMGPFAEVAARGLGDMGGAFGSFMDSVTSSEGTLQGLDTMFRFLDGSITLLGASLEVLSDLYGAFVVNLEAAFLGVAALGVATNNPALQNFGMNWANQMDSLGKGTGDAAGMLRAFGDEVDRAAGGTQTFGESADLAALATGNLRDALSEAHNAYLGFMGAQINTEEAFDRFTESVKENGRTLNIDTEEGRENLRALQGIAEGALEATRRKFEERRSVQEATTVYEAHRKKLYETATALGYAEDVAKLLVDQWLGLAALPDITKQVTIKYRITGKNEIPASFGAGFFEGEGRAAGGPVLPGVPYKINEHGSETVTFPANGMVHPANLTPMVGASATNARPLTISGAGLGQLVFDWLVGEIRTRGGTLAAIGIRNP